MIHARTTCTLSLRELRKLNVQAHEADWDLFDSEGIPQRDIAKSHMTRLRKVAVKNFEDAPHLPVFPTPVLIRVFKKAAKLEKAPKPEKLFRRSILAESVQAMFGDITHSNAIEGQHRTFAVLGLDETFDDLKIEVTLIACDDADAERLFYEINGTARKMSPAAIDLSLAHQQLNGAELDVKASQRALAARLTREFINYESHAYSGHIEMPFSRPPVERPWLRFHRTANSLRWMVNDLHDSASRDAIILDYAMKLAAFWQAMGVVLNGKVFGQMATYGNTAGADQWAHAHLFAIFTEGLLPAAMHNMPTTGDVLDIAVYLKPAVNKFFETFEHDGFVLNGFRNLGGSSSSAVYINAMKIIANNMYGDKQ